MTFPVKGGRITQKFSAKHKGWDIAPPKPGQTGVPCLSPEAATVSISSYQPKPEGNFIILKGSSGRYYYFGHFASRSVKTGQKVKQGQKIGVLGMTGTADGIHTHFEIRPTIGAFEQINPQSIKWEEDDMCHGKESHDWHKLYVNEKDNSSDWKRVAENRHKSIKARDKTIAELRKQLEDSPSKFKVLADKVKALIPFTK